MPVRQRLLAPGGWSSRTGPFLAPRLRLEPNPTCYLHTARSYAFLQTYLEAGIPESVSQRLTGRRQGGDRGIPLMEELGYMRNLFYGFHLVSCEDIGMRIWTRIPGFRCRFSWIR